MVGAKIRRKMFLLLMIVLMLSLSAYFASADLIYGETIVGRLINESGGGVENMSVILSTTTMKALCSNYSGCYCNAPTCSVSLTTGFNGTYSTVADNMLFDDFFYCNESGGPEVNVTSDMSCAPSPGFGTSYVDDEADFIQTWVNATAAILWVYLWDNESFRYANPEISWGTIVFEVISEPPVIQGIIPNQSGEVNTSWTYNLSAHLDNTTNWTWWVNGVNPLLLDVSVNGSNVTFTPKTNKYGYDRIVFELVNTEYNTTDFQEVIVFINKTIEFKQGWNLFSLPIVENNSIKNVMAPLGNGNWGCGRSGMNPYYCNASAGDFEGNWTIIWAQKSPNNFEYFWPADYYQNIDSQSLQHIDPEYGYWIKMGADVNLTIDYR